MSTEKNKTTECINSDKIESEQELSDEHICISNDHCGCDKIHTFAPVLNIPCKLDDKCITPNCWGRHPNRKPEDNLPILNTMTMELCKNRKPCRNKKCRRIHNRSQEPVSFIPSWGVCPYGEKCLYKNSCTLVHEKILKPCIFGGCCNQEYCPFTHKTNVPCKFKGTCMKRGCLHTCKRYLNGEPCQGCCVYTH